jgi:hypothetical protein
MVALQNSFSPEQPQVAREQKSKLDAASTAPTLEFYPVEKVDEGLLIGLSEVT